MITGIHHFSIISSSEESIVFYKKLGFKEVRRIEREYDTVVLMEGSGIGLTMFIDSNHPARTSPEPFGLRQVALCVDCIETTLEYLELKKESIITDWNGEQFIEIKDPDGLVIQLYESSDNY